MGVIMILCMLAGIANGQESGSGFGSSEQEPDQQRVLADLLERSRRAVFGDQAAPDVRISGTTTQYGIEGQFSFDQSSSGGYRRDVTGSLAMQQGFNGDVAWENDWCRSTRILDFTERDRYHLVNLIQFGGWLHFEQQLQLELDESLSNSECHAIRLRFSDASEVATLLINRRSFLPDKLILASSVHLEEIDFCDYRNEGGVTLAYETNVSIGEDKFTEKVTSVTLNAVMPDFDPPPTDLSSVTFSTTVRELKIKRAPTGHVLVSLSFNEVEPVWFIFDTGAGGTIVDRQLVESLNLKGTGSINVLSFLGMQPASIIKLENIELGAVKLDSLYALDMDLAFLEEAMGEKISGIIGYDLLAKCLTEIRLADDQVFVHDPETFDGATCHWQPLKLDRRLPLLPARVNELPVELFRIDVGASGEFFSNVVFHTPYAKAQNLAEQFGSGEFKMPPHEFSTGTLPRFEFAGQSFVDANVGFSINDTSPFNDVYSMGNVGVEFLKPFAIFLDYSSCRYAIKPASDSASK